MRKFYLAGGFNFTYEQFNNDKSAILKDYRAKIFSYFGKAPYELLGMDEHFTKYITSVQFTKGTTYIGPFYYYQKENENQTEQQLVVKTENNMLSDCTDVVFFITNDKIPGTIVELITAAILKKNIHIFYIPDFDNTIGGSVDSKCWYPIEFCKLKNGDKTTIIPVKDEVEFRSKLINIIKIK